MLYTKFMEKYFEKKLTYNQITFRYAVGESIEKGNEIHPYCEILYFMDGSGVFLSEQFQENTQKESLFLIPDGNYHRFQLENQNNYARLVITFPRPSIEGEIVNSLMDEIKIIKDVREEIKETLKRMAEVLSSSDDSTAVGVYLYGSFLMVMAELSLFTPSLELPTFTPKNQLISSCIKYIEDNLTENLSVKIIAEEMNVSEATLFKCFKKNLGISVYKYILEKRLLMAHKLIRSNKNPTKIYLECGYTDYPAFYKGYVKMFGHPPSKDK